LLPRTQSWSRRWYWPRAFERVSKFSDEIITISEASKKDIVDRLRVDPERVTVTKMAIDREMFKPRGVNEVERVKQKYGLGEKYILFVGTRDLRKNVSGLIRAFSAIKKQVPHELVVAGKPALKDDQVKITAAENKAGKRVKFLDFVEGADLPGLYSGAELFAWPSIYEGWGFPPQEAMACGTPVIVSDGGSLPEVVGEAGVVVKFDEEEVAMREVDEGFESKLSQAMLNMLSNDEERRRLRVMGLERVKEFNWEAVARDTIKVYKKII